MPKISSPRTKVIETVSKSSRASLIRNVYLYLVSIVGLITFVVGGVGMIDNVLQNYVFHVSGDIYLEAYPYRNGICAQPFPSPVGDEKNLITPTTQEIETCLQAQKDQQLQNQKNMVARQFSTSIAQIAIGLPLWIFHWMLIEKDDRKKKKGEA